MVIQQIRSATLRIRYGGLTILVDPWLQDRGTGFSATPVRAEMVGVRSPLNALPMSPEAILDGVDFCLVTHVHPDHFTPDYLPKRMKLVVQNRADREAVESMGFEDVAAFEEGALRFGSVTIERVPAIHGDNPAVVAQMGPGSGYVLSGEARTLYVAGDTVYCPEVEAALRRYGPDVIAVNCCEATMPMGRLIMNLSDVESVCRAAPDALVIATHLDSVNHALLSGDDVRRFAHARGLTRLRVPRNGESIEI